MVKKLHKTYTYEERTYEISSPQFKILKYIKSLPNKHLHYVVGQQSNKHRNLTLKELKICIRRGIYNYFKNDPYVRRENIDKLIQYFCVFETTKGFFLSQHENKIVSEDIEMGLHFHLFITSPDNYPWVSFTNLIHGIFCELTYLPHNHRCIRKYDYTKLITLPENFILYHTKQFMYNPSNEMIMTNLGINSN
ncbi:MAG: hypothetical protein LW852_03595 [Sediminibacterium sp.]|jgi:hypothetical protein|nr:hypothetical protein [Sediminibacterium sp.]